MSSQIPNKPLWLTALNPLKQTAGVKEILAFYIMKPKQNKADYIYCVRGCLSGGENILELAHSAMPPPSVQRAILHQ